MGHLGKICILMLLAFISVIGVFAFYLRKTMEFQNYVNCLWRFGGASIALTLMSAAVNRSTGSDLFGELDRLGKKNDWGIYIDGFSWGNSRLKERIFFLSFVSMCVFVGFVSGAVVTAYISK
ncbi:MAG: hypothetical protein F8N37_09865 [Telmatospirillum sp.]|nr:hypothetical protein [Telmatospirillum sp.]